MRKVQIVVDSAVDLPENLLKKHNLSVVPYHIIYGDKAYLDGIDITTKDLYEKVKKENILPKTSAIMPITWKAYFDKHIEEDKDVFCIILSSKISSTFQNAYLASQEYPNGRVVVADSKSLSGGIGLLTLKAAKLRDEGLTAIEIKEEIDKMVMKLQTQFVIKTLEYLHRGGRCSALARVFGTVLSIKPQIKMFDGKLDVYKKTVGKMSRSVDLMLDDFFKVVDEGRLDNEFVFITHSEANTMAKYITNKLKEKDVKIENLIVSNAGTVISSHCGPGTIGILYLEK